MKIIILLFGLALVFFSFRLSKVPRGLTLDEGAFGYNAVLLSRTLKDENGRKLPVFILSLNAKDWRQPVPEYLMAGFFKIFGASLYNLRLVSVLTASVSALLIFFLTSLLLGSLAGIFSYIIFLVTPLILMHSHLGLDILTPLPFILIWSISVLLFDRRKNNLYLALAGMSLGIAFYSYKAMRVFVPVWSLLTLIYLTGDFFSKLSKKNLLKISKPLVFFSLSLAPFFLAVPLLEYKYAGAILGGSQLSFSNIYQYFRSYLSSFDPSFVFIEGDAIVHHSTGRHGMILLTSLPLILIGIYQGLKTNKYWKFLIASFILGPLLIGTTSSYHRATRLGGLIPFYTLFAAYGLVYLFNLKNKLLFVGITILLVLNSYSFLKYYWYSYADDTYNHFFDTNIETSYKALRFESAKNNLEVYQTADMIPGDDQRATNDFLRSIYFTKELPIYKGEIANFPQNAILITHASDLNLTKLDSGLPSVYLYKR